MRKSFLTNCPALNAVGCLLNAALFLGCAPEDKMTPTDFYNKGIEHHEAKEFAAAIEAYGTAINHWSLDKSTSGTILANGYKLRGAARMGIRMDEIFLNKIILLEKSEAGPDRERLQEDSAFRLAVADFTHAIALDNWGHGDPRIQLYSLRAMAYYCLGDFEHAAADYTAALAIDPKCGEALHNRGCVNLCLNETDTAEKDFTSAQVNGVQQD